MPIRFKIFLSVLISSLLWGCFSVWSLDRYFLKDPLAQEETLESQNLLLSLLASEISQKAYGYMISVESQKNKLRSRNIRWSKNKKTLQSQFGKKNPLDQMPLDFFISIKTWKQKIEVDYSLGSSRLGLSADQVSSLLIDLPPLRQGEMLWWNLKNFPSYRALLTIHESRLLVGFYNQSYFYNLNSVAPSSFFLIDRQGFVIADKNSNYGGVHLKNNPWYRQVLEGGSAKGKTDSLSTSEPLNKKLNLSKVEDGSLSHLQKVAGTNLFTVISSQPSFLTFSGWVQFILGFLIILFLTWVLVYISVRPVVQSLAVIVKGIFKISHGLRLDLSGSESLPFGIAEELNSIKRKLGSIEDKEDVLVDESYDKKQDRASDETLKSLDKNKKESTAFSFGDKENETAEVSEEKLAFELFSKWSENDKASRGDAKL